MNDCANEGEFFFSFFFSNFHWIFFFFSRQKYLLECFYVFGKSHKIGNVVVDARVDGQTAMLRPFVTETKVEMIVDIMHWYVPFAKIASDVYVVYVVYVVLIKSTPLQHALRGANTPLPVIQWYSVSIWLLNIRRILDIWW